MSLVFRRIGSILTALLLPVISRGSDQVSPTVDISITGGTVTSHGTLTYYCGTLFSQCSVDLEHRLGDIATSSGTGYLAIRNVASGATETVYDDVASWSGEPGHCFQATMSGVGSEGSSQRVSSGSPCIPYNPPPPPAPGPNYCNSDYDGTNRPDCMSPVIINLGHGGYQLSGPDDSVGFDINATGVPVRITWTARGTAMAFLALDRNGNGVIDDGSELFGNHTPLPGDMAAANGFQALAQYDANGDGVLNADDPMWWSLLLWTDLDHDGVSQPSEIAPLSASAVTAIGLSYHWSGRRDAFGNTFRYQSQVWIRGFGDAIPRPVYDVFFVAAP